jgi:DNA polymerase III subunit delta'
MTLSLKSSAKVAQSRVLEILKKTADANRLSHALILHGQDPDLLQQSAELLAERILGRSIKGCPDFYELRPQNKMRQISADAMRDLIHSLQRSAFAGTKKVALVLEADRLNAVSANAFLKTLEEPSPGTTLILTTTALQRVLPTIRSRAMAIRIPGEASGITDSRWIVWLEHYDAWMRSVQSEAATSPITRAGWILRAHELIAAFEAILEALSAEAWKPLKSALKDATEPEVLDAMEVGLAKRLRADLFKSISQQTRKVALRDIDESEFPARARALSRLIGELERLNGLLQVNLQESVALEAFFLESLSIWAQKS